MSFNKLNPEIWLHIIDCLRPPIHRPLSGLTKQEAINEPIEVVERLPDESDEGVIGRKDIRSEALATLMRTSIAFNQLSSIALYQRVVTDDVPFLISGFGAAPSHPQVESKLELLGHIRKLHLEYGQKAGQTRRGNLVPTYSQLLEARDRWMWVTASLEDTTRLRMSFEMESLHEAAHHSSLYPHALFPALTHLTSGMLFGGQGGLWDWLGEEGNEAWRAKVEQCKLYLVATFQQSPILHFCQRGHDGPLSLPHPIFIWSDPRPNSTPHNPLFTIHFNISPGSNKMPVAIGHPTRWTLEERPPIEHYDVLLMTTTAAFGPLLGDVTAQRLSLTKDHPAGTKTNFDLQLYATTTGLSSPMPVSTPAMRTSGRPEFSPLGVDDRRIELDSVKKYGPAFLPQFKALGFGDSFGWAASTESPPCEACGWIMEALPETVEDEGTQSGGGV